MNELEGLLREATDRYERTQIELSRTKSENERLQKLLDDALRQQGASVGADAAPEAAASASVTTAPSSAPAAPAQEPPPGDAGQSFQAAQRLLQQSRFAEAEIALTNFLKYYPTSSDAPEALYWLGRTQIVRGRHSDAAATFVELLRQSPRMPRAADGWVRLGIALRNMGQVEQACATFKDLAVRYPNAPASVKQLSDDQARQAQCTR